MYLSPRQKSKFPKRTQIRTERRISLASANAPIKQATANPQHETHDAGDPVIDVRASVEARLDEFNGAPEGRRADEDGEQANAARARQREGERREGYEVHQLVASLRRRRRLVHGPEHRDGQGERHGDREGDVEVLAHPPGCSGRAKQRQARAAVGCIRGKIESRS